LQCQQVVYKAVILVPGSTLSFPHFQVLNLVIVLQLQTVKELTLKFESKTVDLGRLTRNNIVDFPNE